MAARDIRVKINYENIDECIERIDECTKKVEHLIELLKEADRLIDSLSAERK